MREKLFSTIQTNFKPEYQKVPNKGLLFNWLEDVLTFLFPTEEKSTQELTERFSKIEANFIEILFQAERSKAEAKELSELFHLKLNCILEDLHKDAQEFLENDPASSCLGEVLHTYPGFYAISIYRIAHCLSKDLRIIFIPRMLTEYAHSRTGIDIHPNADIASPFFIDHGTGVVIGETCKIGKNVNIYQGVTLGALQVSKELSGKKRHPTVEDGVVIYANATILGGNTIVGNNSVIGGNVFLTKSVNPYSLVYTKSETIVKPLKTEEGAIHFII